MLSDSDQGGFVGNRPSNSHSPLNILLTLPNLLTHYITPQYIHHSPLPVSMYTLPQYFNFSECILNTFHDVFLPKGMPTDLPSAAPCLSSAEFLAFKNTSNLPGTKWDMKNQFQLQCVRQFPGNKSI